MSGCVEVIVFLVITNQPKSEFNKKHRLQPSLSCFIHHWTLEGRSIAPFMPALQRQYLVLSDFLILILFVIQVYMCLCVYWWHGAVMCSAVTQTHWTCLDSVNEKQVDLSLYIRQDYIQQSHPCMKTQPLLGLRLRATVRLNVLILLRVCYHSLQLQVRIVHSCPYACVLPSPYSMWNKFRLQFLLFINWLIDRSLYFSTTSVLTAIFQVNLGWLVASLAVFIGMLFCLTFSQFQMLLRFVLKAPLNSDQPASRTVKMSDVCSAHKRVWCVSGHMKCAADIAAKLCYNLWIVCDFVCTGRQHCDQLLWTGSVDHWLLDSCWCCDDAEVVL